MNCDPGRCISSSEPPRDACIYGAGFSKSTEVLRRFTGKPPDEPAPKCKQMKKLPLFLAILLPFLARSASKQPNIVFIFSDDHSYQAISAYSDPRKLLQTPNIDRLAHEGMRFDRCLVPNSICGPSRATVLTGKY